MSDEPESWIAPASGSDALMVAELAAVPDEFRDRFCSQLGLALVEAHKWTVVRTKVPLLRADDIRGALKAVRTAAEKLERLMGELENEPFDPSRRLAFTLLELELCDAECSDKPLRSDSFLSRYRKRMKALVAATERARIRAGIFAKEGRPKGVGGNPAFDWFVATLYHITQLTGGRLTHYRERGGLPGEFCGSLRPVMEVLRPHLPTKGFFPTNTDLDYALERLSEWGSANTAKTPSKN